MAASLSASTAQVGSGGHCQLEAISMALYPCDIGGHRYSGSQQTIYPALVDGSFSARCKLRLCPMHFGELLELLQTTAHDAQLDPIDAHRVACIGGDGAVTDSSWVFFATVYPRGDDRVDFWAPVHAACTEAVAARWGVLSQMP